MSPFFLAVRRGFDFSLGMGFIGIPVSSCSVCIDKRRRGMEGGGIIRVTRRQAKLGIGVWRYLGKGEREVHETRMASLQIGRAHV